jgi:hypothetical protein
LGYIVARDRDMHRPYSVPVPGSTVKPQYSRGDRRDHGHDDVLPETARTSEQIDAIVSIRSSGGGPLSISNDLFNFSKVESGDVCKDASPRTVE